MKTVNIEKDITVGVEGKSVTKLQNEADALIAVAKLLPGSDIPSHNTNADVNIIVLEGSVKAYLENDTAELSKSDFITVLKETKMKIENSGDTTAVFIIIKAPNPGPAV
jgi:quercetin dioxygenase-like cupin family protein